MLARLSAFVIWSLVALTATFWMLRFVATPPRAPAYAVPVDRSAPAHGDLARLFGTTPAVAAAGQALPEASSRFRLLGVMAPKGKSADESSAYGLALIAVDGKPARAFAVGARLESDLVLQSVGLRSASLGPAQGGRSVLLELPALPAPATGVLPQLGAPAANIPNVARAVPARLPTPMPPAGIPLMGLPVPPMMQSQQPGQPPPMPGAPELPPNPAMPTSDDPRSQ